MRGGTGCNVGRCACASLAVLYIWLLSQQTVTVLSHAIFSGSKFLQQEPANAGKGVFTPGQQEACHDVPDACMRVHLQSDRRYGGQCILTEYFFAQLRN